MQHIILSTTTKQKVILKSSCQILICWFMFPYGALFYCYSLSPSCAPLRGCLHGVSTHCKGVAKCPLPGHAVTGQNVALGILRRPRPASPMPPRSCHHAHAWYGIRFLASVILRHVPVGLMRRARGDVYSSKRGTSAVSMVFYNSRFTSPMTLPIRGHRLYIA